MDKKLESSDIIPVNFVWLNKCEILDVAKLDYTSFFAPESPELEWTAYFKIIFALIVIITTVFGNGAVIIVITMNKLLRSTINYYLTNLAVVDIIFCVICLWVHVVNSVTFPRYVLGPFICKFNGFTHMTCLTCSVLTLSAISCDRFVAVYFPLRSRVTKSRTKLVIIIIWLISIVVSMPFLVTRKYYIFQWKNRIQGDCIEQWPGLAYFNKEKEICIFKYLSKTLYYSLVTIILFFIPIIIMTTSYSLIIWRLWVRRIPSEAIPFRNNQELGISSMKKVIKMVFLVMIFFMIAWIPLQVAVLYSVYYHTAHDYGQLPSWFYGYSNLSLFVAYFNSAINPLIYGGYNQKFRDSLCLILQCKFKLIKHSSLRKHENELKSMSINDCRNSRAV